MSGGIALATMRFPVGAYHCTYTLTHGPQGLAINSVWEPEMPTKKTMTPEMWAEYRKYRGIFNEEIEAKTGLKILVVEV